MVVAARKHSQILAFFARKKGGSDLAHSKEDTRGTKKAAGQRPARGRYRASLFL